MKAVGEPDWAPSERRLWQRGYNDRVIGSGEEWQRIHTYIEFNPVQWSLDGENPARIT